MIPPSYHLDTAAVLLIERLEGARRTWMNDPTEAAAGLRRNAEELVDGIVREHNEIMGDTGWGDVLRREMMETFLPRYIRLAVQHNEHESRGFGAWRGGDPIARILATAMTVFAGLVLNAIFHHPIVILVFMSALFVPVLPEIRSGYARRQYRIELQQAVSDMERIQQGMERFRPEEVAGPDGESTDEEEAQRQRQLASVERQKERNL